MNRILLEINSGNIFNYRVKTMTYGLTNAGFIRKTRESILLELRERARLEEFFGSSVDLSAYSPEGILLELMASSLDEAWQKLEGNYNANFLDTSEGINLDRVVGLGGIQRNPAQRALVTLEFTGNVGAEVPVNTLVETEQGISFVTVSDTPQYIPADPDAPLAEKYTIALQAKASISGPESNVPENSITNMINSPVGLDSATNPLSSSGGREIETDWELRQRYKTRGTSGGSSAIALQTLLADLDFINSATVYENTSALEVEGRPPKSIECVIEGDMSETNKNSIAEILLHNKPAGIEIFAFSPMESYSIEDNTSTLRTFSWSTPGPVPVYVIINIEKAEDWLDTNVAIVKSNVLKIIGGVETLAGGGTLTYEGSGIGVDIFAWELAAAQRGVEDKDTVKVPGILSISTTVGENSDLSDQNPRLIISERGKASITTENITVNLI